VDSPFVFCRELATETYNNKGVDFRISFIGLQEVPWERVLNDFQKFTKRQLKDFKHFPSKTFHFINIITPYSHYHGVEHRASTVIVLGPNYKIFESYYDELLGISSHELYHVWNVKSIRSVDLWPYDYSRENLSTMGYLCEGITTYMGDFYLMQSGVWSPEKYLRELEVLIQKHIDNLGRVNSSLAESSYDTWLDGYVAGAPNRKVSIYNEGALFAFITDIFIRSQTQGKKTIKDVMHTLYHQFFLKNQGVTDENFIQIVEEAANETPFREIFQELVYKRVSYEARIIEALEGLGFDLELEDNPEPISARLGIKTTHENGFARINTILTGSDGDLAGLSIGDKIMAINDFVVNNDFEQWINHFKDEMLHVIVNRQGRVLQLEIPNSNINYFKRARIVPLAIPSGLSLRVYSYWSGKKEIR
jgi:predicted metalloprotease with PDZ domain